MKQAVVTGASKGIGKAFAYLLAARGYDLLLVARSEKILSEEANTIIQKHGVKVYALSLDLSNSNSAALILDWCQQHQFNPSVLINNAGYACWGFFDKIDLRQHQQMMQVNVGTLFNLTYGMLPLLRKNEQSYILNVASTTAFQAVPTMTLYAASKSFVRSFSRGLRYELRNSNVSVTCLSPGPVATNFIEQAGMQVMQETAKKFEMSPEEVASTGLKAMFNKKAESVPGFLNYITIKFSFILPDALLEKIAGNIYLSKMK
jgi:short-subunit dehydrogenase